MAGRESANLPRVRRRADVPPLLRSRDRRTPARADRKRVCPAAEGARGGQVSRRAEAWEQEQAETSGESERRATKDFLNILVAQRKPLALLSPP